MYVATVEVSEYKGSEVPTPSEMAVKGVEDYLKVNRLLIIHLRDQSVDIMTVHPRVQGMH